MSTPPPENWIRQDLPYGFVIDRSRVVSYNAAPRLIAPSPADVHLLNVNPQALSRDRPFSTSVRGTLGGGKFIESQGLVKASFSISGTTGLLAPVAQHATHLASRNQNGSNTVAQLARSSGFYEFHRLEQLFENYGAAKRRGENVHMHFLNFIDDEYWRVEPKLFSAPRTVGDRFTRRYSIQLDGIEPSTTALASFFSTLIPAIGTPSSLTRQREAAFGLSSFGVGAYLDAPTRRAAARLTQLATAGSTFFETFGTGVVALKAQAVLASLDRVQSTLASVTTVRRTLLADVIAIYSQTLAALGGLYEAWDANTPAAVLREVNEWTLEVRFLTEAMIALNADRFGSNPGQDLLDANTRWTTARGAQGTGNRLLPEAVGSAGSLTVLPGFGGAGFDLVGSTSLMGQINGYQAVVIQTGETIFDVAQRVLGDVQRFIDLVVLNRLKPPFIVAAQADRYEGTLAWGDHILVPAITSSALASGGSVSGSVVAFGGTCSVTGTLTQVVDDDILTPPGQWRVGQWEGFTVTVTSGANAGQSRWIVSNTADTLTVNRAWASALTAGTTYEIALRLFSRRRPSTPETRAYGRDLLAVIPLAAGLGTSGKVDIALGPGGFAVAEGAENLQQALTLRALATQGDDPVHPEYGQPNTIGRAWNPGVAALYSLYARTGFLQDPRVAAVLQPRVFFDGTTGASLFEATIQPVDAGKAVLFRSNL